MRELNAYDLNTLMDLVRSEPVPGEALVPKADPVVSYDDFLELLPAELRGSMECRACRLWWWVRSQFVSYPLVHFTKNWEY